MKKKIKTQKKIAGNSSTSVSSFCRALKAHNHFLLASHVSPEGDAVGSLVAMDSLLRRIGKKTTIICEDPFPDRLRCIPFQNRWRSYREARGKTNFKALLVTDCPTLERIGKVKELIGKDTVIFNIDHHVSNAFFGKYNCVLPKAAASGEVVYDIFKEIGLRLTKQEAAALYVSLSTDTGSFKHSNTGIRAHRMAAELIQSGIDIERINEELYSSYSLSKIELYSRLLGKVETAFGGKVAWVAMKREDREASGATYDDTEGFIDFLKFLKEVKIAFFLSEMKEKNKVKVSFRSKGSYDVNQIATRFGGGGHRKASGCTLSMPLSEAPQRVLNEIQKRTRFR